MRSAYVCGFGLACSLGLGVDDALRALRQGGRATSVYLLPGAMGGNFPYYTIPLVRHDWNDRARELVRRVATESGAQQIRTGALFIATSSFDIGAVEQGTAAADYNAFSSKVAAWLDWLGPVFVISTACTSSLNALLAAQALLDTGEIEDALILGIELDNRLTLAGFAALQLLSASGSKPFGRYRDGLVLGEAVAAVRLSASETSRWSLLGGANVVDGSQPTGASPVAVAAMYQQTLAAAGLAASAIDLIKVQAVGSPGNDAVEAQGIRETFSAMPPLVSFKAVIGHAMGAAGVAEIALLATCLDAGVWPNYSDEIDVSLGVALESLPPADVQCVMATILGFGGSHASVVLERV